MVSEILRRFVYIFFTIVPVLLSGCYDSHSQGYTSSGLPVATATVSELRELCGDPLAIGMDITLVCRVTSSDRAGNFYRTLFAEDATGAVEIFVGTYNIAAKYPAGTLLALRLKGCAAAITDGVLQIGLEAQSYSTTAVDYFQSDIVLDRHIVRGSTAAEVLPLEIGINDAAENLCGRLVHIGGLYYSPADTEDDGICGGYRRFTDGDGNDIYTTVSEYADFADGAIPAGVTAVCGILLQESVPHAGRRFVVKPIDSTGYEVGAGSDN